MKNRTYVILVAILIILLVACTGTPSTPSPVPPVDLTQPARHALENFLNALHNGRYEEAVRLYGGQYDMMITQNPMIEPEDLAKLLQNACTNNGFMCLQWQSIELERSISETEFLFNVQFQHADGTLFVLGPCCGASETEFPPQTSFPFRVALAPDGKMLTMDMVPYMP